MKLEIYFSTPSIPERKEGKRIECHCKKNSSDLSFSARTVHDDLKLESAKFHKQADQRIHSTLQGDLTWNHSANGETQEKSSLLSNLVEFQEKREATSKDRVQKMLNHQTNLHPMNTGVTKCGDRFEYSSQLAVGGSAVELCRECVHRGHGLKKSQYILLYTANQVLILQRICVKKFAPRNRVQVD